MCNLFSKEMLQMRKKDHLAKQIYPASIGNQVLEQVDTIIASDEAKLDEKQQKIQRQQSEAVELTKAMSGVDTENRRTQAT
uniref:Uncharacterized protein n=1 Tax=Glossina palpalis gambiensis TaxID=67801 RepID=A0A1B0AS18_9MUSC